MLTSQNVKFCVQSQVTMDQKLTWGPNTLGPKKVQVQIRSLTNKAF